MLDIVFGVDSLGKRLCFISYGVGLLSTEELMLLNCGVGWHCGVDRHEFEQALGDEEGQGNLHAAVHGVIKTWTQLSN